MIINQARKEGTQRSPPPPKSATVVLVSYLIQNCRVIFSQPSALTREVTQLKAAIDREEISQGWLICT